ncbi:MAG: adenine phosphoribosyltransferase [Selenomonadaceae bacterium]|nr:adenine phosphoribosyltransferase [Selenomonadaceae bacterium]
MRTYELNVAGVTRQLPILNISNELAIAAFVILGDAELTQKTAIALAEKAPRDVEILMTAETKGIPLVIEMARALNMNRYVVARKSIKGYMNNVIFVEDFSITTKGKQMLYVADDDINLIKGKKVLLVDDVISTGGSMKALKTLAEKAGAKVIGQAAILAEGDAKNRDDIIFLEDLPLFKAE